MASPHYDRILPDYRGSKTEFGLHVVENDACIGLAVWPAHEGFDDPKTQMHYAMMGPDEARDLIAALQKGVERAEMKKGKKRLGR